MENIKLVIVLAAIAVVASVGVTIVVMNLKGDSAAVAAKPAPKGIADSASELAKQREALDAKIKQAEAQTNALNTAVETSKKLRGGTNVEFLSRPGVRERREGGAIIQSRRNQSFL